MKIFVVVAAFLAVAYARPEAPFSGYAAAAPPSGSYGAPQPQYGAPAQEPTVHKHVYVHVPPPEPEYQAPPKVIPVAPAQKHYKIIFIKAPTPPTPTAPIIPAQPQNEEKTLVYVLVKKPEEAPEIVIPTPAPTQPSKPEVYFIKYKTQKEEAGGYPASGVPDNAGPPSSSYGAPSSGGYQ
ncbi:extensin-3 [Coccinella septempunctata]|uniref:extensin-3 n=1 Tax=Coccinella septempunctata TaxID=41139 RepID=UPI001D071A44|nr:extensin-3 [Coccinella septempunctata]